MDKLMNVNKTVPFTSGSLFQISYLFNLLYYERFGNAGKFFC